MNTSARVIWSPVEGELRNTNIVRFAEFAKKRYEIDVYQYDAMWQWSVDSGTQFWSAVWEFFEIGEPVDPASVLRNETMPGATWFPDTKVNLAEHLLRERGRGDSSAIVTVGESGDRQSLTWDQLRRDVGALASTLRGLGVAKGDVVAAYLPNIGETIVASLATMSLGAIWAGVGQEYAANAAIARFAQLDPVVLFVADGHQFGGKTRDHRDAVSALRTGLPTVRCVIGVSRIGLDIPDTLSYSDAIKIDASWSPVSTSFEDPLWVLFSSGTTGLPKGIVHSHGGVLLEQSKLMSLHWDISPEDILAWYTSPSWVMWNALIGALTLGCTVVCFDGAPIPDGENSLWKIVAEEHVTVFGTSPGFLAMSQDAAVRPATQFDLSKLRAMGSTGAPLPERAYDYVWTEVGPIPLWSMSGGTDVAGAFAVGAPNVPVWAGELSVRALGISVEAWSDDGHPLVGQVGELVVTQPIPSMPIRFWNDPLDERYRAAYFETFPGVWRHGDWITVTNRGSVIVHGRSDSTLNRHGVRMGSSDVYSAVESMDEVSESLVIGAEESDGGYWMPLFVVLHPEYELDEHLAAVIKTRIREYASPRHVPDEIIAVAGIPHTRTGKKLEIPIKRLIQGDRLKDVVDMSVVDNAELFKVFEVIAAQRLAVVGRVC